MTSKEKRMFREYMDLLVWALDNARVGNIDKSVWSLKFKLDELQAHMEMATGKSY